MNERRDGERPGHSRISFLFVNINTAGCGLRSGATKAT
jgi:hypothetical protein